MDKNEKLVVDFINSLQTHDGWHYAVEVLECWHESSLNELVKEDAISKDSEIYSYLLEHEVAHVEHYGGEGEGETYYDVFHIGDVYVKISGCYSSYNGTDYYGDALSVVEPVEVTVTQYHRKKS